MDKDDVQYALPIGTLIQGFRIVKILGAGNFGIVYLAENTYFNETVALKELLPIELACRKEECKVVPLSSETENTFLWALNKFLEEARILRQFSIPNRHPNIVGVTHFMKTNGTAYMVMDYEKGRPLSELLEEKGTIPEKDLKGYLYPLLNGLSKIHEQNIWHRDIKPSNILIRSDGSPVLIDFGSARRDTSDHPRSIFTSFTPTYAAPEQFYGGGSLGPWTDIYALGSTLYRAVTGAKPVNAAVMGQENSFISAVKAADADKGYSQSFLSAIDAAMQRDIQNRPQSVDEWRALFEKTSITKLNSLKNDEPTIVHHFPNQTDKTVPVGNNIDTVLIDNNINKDDSLVSNGRWERVSGSASKKFRNKLVLFTVMILIVAAGFISKILFLSPKNTCDRYTSLNDPIGFVCAYFKDCQNRNIETAVQKVSPDLAEFLGSEIKNSEYYDIIELSLNEQVDNTAEVYTKYTYKGVGQAPVSYIGPIRLKKNRDGQWEIIYITQTTFNSP